METTQLKALIRQLIEEQMHLSPIRLARPAACQISAADKLDTGRAEDQVYTHDLFTLQESPRLGCGLMEMEHTTFPWELNYDEIDYVLEGSLTICMAGTEQTAKAGELLLIPKGSKIQFSAPDYAKFLYFTYPADWANQS